MVTALQRVAITTILPTIIFVDRLIFMLQVIYNGVEKSCTAKSLKPNTEYTITVSWFRTIQGEFILLCLRDRFILLNEWMNEWLNEWNVVDERTTDEPSLHYSELPS